MALSKKIHSNAKSDLCIIAVLILLKFSLSVFFDFGEEFAEFAERHEHLELDEFLFTLSFGSLAFAWFAYRRWREYSVELKNRNIINTQLAQEIAERESVEADLIEHRNNLQVAIDEATEELQAQANELKNALDKEKDLNELQNQFVTMASHEFRTPLAIIDGAAQRLSKRAESLEPGETVRRTEKIRNAVRRMTRLIDSVLTAASMEQGRISIEMAPCNIGEILNDVCSHQQELSNYHDISCELTGLTETIQADPGALDQIFTNLLSNAVKYSPDEKDIEVTAYTEDDCVVVSVRDHGLGLDDDDLGNLFERFFRAKNTAGIAGTGIGLNLVRSLVEMHDGSVDVESEKSKGSTFSVRLPIAGPDRMRQMDSKAA